MLLRSQSQKRKQKRNLCLQDISRDVQKMIFEWAVVDMQTWNSLTLTCQLWSRWNTDYWNYTLVVFHSAPQTTHVQRWESNMSFSFDSFQFENLRFLRLSSDHVDSDPFAFDTKLFLPDLSGFRNLETFISDGIMLHNTNQLKKLPKLTSLTLPFNVENATYENVGGLTQLTCLRFPLVRTGSFSTISGLTNLQILECCSYAFECSVGESMKAVKALRSLTNLNITYFKLPLESLRAVSYLPLVRLRISWTIHLATVLCKFGCLQELRVSSFENICLKPPSFWDSLSQLKELRRFTLSIRSQLENTMEVLHAINQLPKLEHVRFIFSKEISADSWVTILTERFSLCEIKRIEFVITYKCCFRMKQWNESRQCFYFDSQSNKLKIKKEGCCTLHMERKNI